MKDEYKNLFRKLGYEVENCCGAVIYSALIDDVRDLIAEGKSKEEVCEVFPTIKLELCRFYFEMTPETFDKSINKFRTINSNMRKDSERLAQMGLSSDGVGLNLFDSVYLFASYFNSASQKEKESKVTR